MTDIGTSVLDVSPHSRAARDDVFAAWTEITERPFVFGPQALAEVSAVALDIVVASLELQDPAYALARGAGVDEALAIVQAEMTQGARRAARETA